MESRWKWCLPIMLHAVNGSPVYPWRQVQIGLWFTTEHSAFNPHEPGHGSSHFWLIQALVWSQSELRVHSGRHVGGFPI